ncbi:LSU ribosomal protein L30P [Alkalispirillum mobile]|uniref:Large ribosomal subunit protein uL30 n=1 Tax=Alkalispirillum mobile TaxID=85925 RepID=A0A498CA11_9GAMM|nr:50S ribosomal protein L30 [Alkalispirillum mobile]RLK51266.1 LSU ribosomal protein L30P [Alkalispirillum mobile]
MTTQKQLKVTQTRSTIGRLASHKACVAGLGLRRINHSVVVADTPENRGMINKVAYLLNVEEC